MKIMKTTEKYAIYKGKVGLYAELYIDTLDGCKDLLCGHSVKESDLPIVVNRAGGKCSFYPVEDNFVKIIEVEEGQEPLTREEMYPKNSPDFEYGWISPEGDTYATPRTGHSLSADYICKELGYKDYLCERELEERGWVKVTFDYLGNKKAVYARKDLFISKKQADRLFDLGLHDDWRVQGYIEYSQGRW